MKNLIKVPLFVGALVFSSCWQSLFAAETNVKSDVTNYNSQVNMDLLVIPILPGGGTDAATIRTSTSATNLILSFTVPSKYILRSIKVRGANCDYTTGDENYNFDIKEALADTMTSASLLSAPINITNTGRNGVGTISDSIIADESLLSVYAYGSGTTPIINDASLVLYLERTN